jgi:hypothetical protein
MMRNLALLLAAALLASLSIVAPAQAQATRTWVSGVGDDANPCSRTAPCKTFAGAISKTAAHGEINVLDPGGFGAVTITKSISIISESVQAGVLVDGTNAIIINAAAGDVVLLKGLNIQGLGPGGNVATSLNGVRILSAAKVHITKSLIQGFTSLTDGNGVAIVPTVNPVTVFISETTITKNRQGIFVNPTNPALVTVFVDRVVLQGNSATAIRTTANGTIRVTNSVITDNNRGLLQAGNGVIISGGGNSLLGNNIEGTFDSTVPQL